MATPLEQVVVLLAFIAEQSGEKVTQTRIEFIAKRLADENQADVVAALTKLADTARRFPTVEEIRVAMGKAAETPEMKGREVAERIWTALCKWGSRSHYRAEVDAYIGPIGVEVVKMQGGWERVCDVTDNDNGPTLKAQWRELAIIVAKKGAAGTLEQPPDFDQLPAAVKDAATALVAKMGRTS